MVAKKSAAKRGRKTAKKSATKTARKTTAKKSARKSSAKKSPAKKSAAKKSTRGTAAKKSTRKVAKKGGRKYGAKASKKIGRVMKEFEAGTLKSGKEGAGGKVKSRQQAIAIGISEAREEGDKVPKPQAARKTSV